MKLNNLLKTNKVTVEGFPAFKQLEEFCNKEGKVVNLCTLPAELLLQQGITEYYAPVIPRGSIFNTAQEIMDADLDVKKYRITEVSEEEIEGKETIIVTRHWAAVNIAHELYPFVTKILLGNVTEEEVKGKNVVGVLPPFLVAKVNSYVAISIKDYNATEGDLSEKEIKDRLIVGKPIKLIECTDEVKIEEFLQYSLQIMKEKEEDCFEDLGRRYRNQIASKYQEIFKKEYDCDADADGGYYVVKFNSNNNRFRIEEIYVCGCGDIDEVTKKATKVYIEYFNNEGKYYSDYLTVEFVEKLFNQ